MAVKSVLQSVDSKMIPKSDSLPKTPDIGVFFCHLPVLVQHCIDTCVCKAKMCVTLQQLHIMWGNRDDTRVITAHL